jgi:uncharacterized membrane protein
MEELFIVKFWDAVKEFMDSINWLFMLLFMIITWLVNAGANIKKLKDDKTYQAWFVLALGVVLSILYGYLNDITTKEGITGLLFAIIAGMVVWKLGISKFEDWIKSKWTKK